MVQIQSSWFPLYDRNPQTYVDNIVSPSRTTTGKAMIKVFHDQQNASFVELPIVEKQVGRHLPRSNRPVLGGLFTPERGYGVYSGGAFVAM
jgi:hypothetical protein